jgi:hypothetical protein
MKSRLTNENKVYKLELENGCLYWSKPGETHADFISRAKEAVWSDHKIRLNKKDMNDFTRFLSARYEAMQEIEFVNYELGRMGREKGQKLIHKVALNKIIQIIDLYNNEEWQAISSITL